MYINRLLGALSFNIQTKSDLYDDPIKKKIFLLNNYHFISKRLENDPKLLALASKHDAELGPKFIQLTTECKEDFMKQWDAVVANAVVSGINLNPGKEQLVKCNMGST